MAHTLNFILNEIEVRVLGSLVEKDITTPDYYPLSLNALVNACNQKNNREPVTNLNEDAVRQALSTLQEKRLAGSASGADSRVTNTASRKSSTSPAEKLQFSALCYCEARKLPANYAAVPSACITSKRWTTSNPPCNA